MEKFKYYFEKYKILICIFVCFIIFGVMLFLLLKPNKSKSDNMNISINEISEVVTEKEELIKVDIKGFVENPGVYEMDINSRVIDVINKAGGLKENSNTEYINLSKKLTDEMIIIIYSNEEVEKYKNENKEIIYIQYECECLDNINDSCITEKDIVNTNGIKGSTSDSSDDLISINTDSVEELTKLDGIGEQKAKKIIEYRKENGNFTSLEDIMKVSGIGESAYSKIKDHIKL